MLSPLFEGAKLASLKLNPNTATATTPPAVPTQAPVTKPTNPLPTDTTIPAGKFGANMQYTNVPNEGTNIETLKDAEEVTNKAQKVVNTGLGNLPADPNSQFQYLQNKITEYGGNADDALKLWNETQTQIDKIVQDFLQTNSIDLAKYQNLFDDASTPKLKISSPQDYFFTKDAEGKVHYTKAGSATLVLALLGQMFGSPQAKAQNLALTQQVGKDWSAQENAKNQAEYQNAVNNLTRQAEAIKAKISFDQSNLTKQLQPLQIKLNAAQTRYRLNMDAKKDTLTKMADVVAKGQADASKMDAQTHAKMRDYYWKVYNDKLNSTDEERLNAFGWLSGQPEFQSADGKTTLKLPYLSSQFVKDNNLSGVVTPGAAPISVQKAQQGIAVSEAKLKQMQSDSDLRWKEYQRRVKRDEELKQEFAKRLAAKGAGKGGAKGGDLSKLDSKWLTASLYSMNQKLKSDDDDNTADQEAANNAEAAAYAPDTTLDKQKAYLNQAAALKDRIKKRRENANKTRQFIEEQTAKFGIRPGMIQKEVPVAEKPKTQAPTKKAPNLPTSPKTKPALAPPASLLPSSQPLFPLLGK